MAILTKRAGPFALLDQLVVSFANFVTGAVIGRACTKDEFGLYMLGLSIVFIVLGPQASLISQPFIVYSPRLKGDTRARYIGSVAIHQLVLSSITVSLLCLFGIFLSIGDRNLELASVVWLLVFVVTFILFRDFTRRICFADMDFRTAFFLDSIASLVQICAFFLLAYFNYLSATSGLLSIGIACGFASVGWIVLFHKKISIVFGDVYRDFRENWAFGKWLFYSSLVWQLGSNIYPWLLTVFHGTASTGVLAACTGVVHIANPVSLAVGNFVGPRIAHAYAKEGVLCLRKLVLDLVIKFSLLVVPFCIAFIVAGGKIATLVYGDKYRDTGFVISVLSINLFASLVGVPLSRAMHALERSDLDFALNCIPLVIMITAGVQLVQLFDVAGVAYGLVAGSLATVLVRWWVLLRITRAVIPRTVE